MQWSNLCLAWLVAAALPMAGRAETKTQARLLLAAETARPGETLMAAVELRMAPGWHTYWRNGGDAGAPTTISWKLPENIRAGDILWPVPEKYESGGLFTYVYHDQVLLLVPLTLGPAIQAGPIQLQAEVSWLECEELCLPGDAIVKAPLTVGQESKPSSHFDLIQKWQAKLPRTATNLDAQARWNVASQASPRQVILEWTARQADTRGDFYPFSADNYSVSAATQTLQTKAPRQIRLSKELEKFEGDWPEDLQGLLVERDATERLVAAYQVRLPIASPSQTRGGDATASPARPSGRTSEPAGASAGSGQSLLLMFSLAFLGGLILNVMPCVLPVIAIKVLGFVNQSKEEPARVRRLGLVYVGGVLTSFLVLAGLVIGVQQTGRLASWGMQFQNPQFLIFMTLLVTLVALNLFGLFEITVGSKAIGAASGLAYREGPSGAFFNGVLATALATPCTAPFLGVALGFAFTQPPLLILLTFLIIGLGLALPYLFLSYYPALLRFVPKPGPWMEKFKIAMGFPMLATALWLLSIVTRHFGTSGVLWLGMFLVLTALAAWIWGQFVQRGGRNKSLARAISLLILATSYGYVLEGKLDWRHPPDIEPASVAQERNPDGIPWQPWSSEAVAQARQQGKPVFVDFTADWCLTCKANAASSIEIPSVRAKLKEIEAVPLLGDYTRPDEAITRELRRFGRAGVPLVLVYPKNTNAPPRVLPNILTPGIVLDALEAAAGHDA